MSEGNPQSPDQEPKQKPEKILVAEDSQPNRKILCHLLDKLGYQTLATEDGQSAWEALQKPENGDVVLVISDIMMPLMDGISLLKNIRNDDRFKQLPVVLVTAVSEKGYILQAKALNVNGYILKPVTFQRVQAKLKDLFPFKNFPKLAG